MLKLPDVEAAMVEHFEAHVEKAGVGLELLPGIRELLEAMQVSQGGSGRGGNGGTSSSSSSGSRRMHSGTAIAAGQPYKASTSSSSSGRTTAVQTSSSYSRRLIM
jgi:hypothetical protein